MPIIDLNHNTVDGVTYPPKVVEIVEILKSGKRSNDAIVRQLYGLNEPEDAANCVRYHICIARSRGIKIKSEWRARRVLYWLQ